MKTEELIARVREMRCLIAVGKFALIDLEQADRLAAEICSRLESCREAMRRAQQATGTSTLTHKILEEELSK